MTLSNQDRIVFGLAILVALPVALVLCAGSVVFPPMVLLLAAGVAGVMLCWGCPLQTLCLGLICQFLGGLLILFPSSGQGDTSFANTLTVAKFVFVGLVAVMLPKILFTKQESELARLRRYPIPILLSVLFILAGMPSLVYSGLGNGFVRVMPRLVSCLSLFMLILALVHDLRALRLVLLALLAVFGVSAIMGLYEAIEKVHILTLLGRPVSQDFDQLAEAGYFRVVGPSGQPVTHATGLVCGMTAALALLSISKHRMFRIFCVLCTGLFVLSIISTGSRGGLLACMVLGGCYFLWGRFPHKWLRLTGALTVGLVLMLLYTVAISPTPLKRFLTVGEADAGTIYRLGFISQCWRMTEDSPIIGVGLGNFNGLQINQYFDDRTPQRLYNPHNVYMQVLAETGPIALLLFLSLFLACALPVLSLALRSPHSRQRSLAASMLGGTLALASFATNDNLRDQETLWVMLALTLVTGYVATTKPGAGDIEIEPEGDAA